MNNLIIAREFSRTPGPRYRQQGNYSGQEFRETILVKAVLRAISKNEILLIDLDGTSGYSTSFLEESFGGLIRLENISLSDIKAHVKFKSDEDVEYLEEIESYLQSASNANKSLVA